MADDKHGPACPDCGGEMHEVTTFVAYNEETGERIEFATFREAIVFLIAKAKEAGEMEDVMKAEKVLAEYDEYHRRKIN